MKGVVNHISPTCLVGNEISKIIEEINLKGIVGFE